MVQYVFTPWRDRQELLLVRDQFYGSDAVGGRITLGAGAAAAYSHRKPDGRDEHEHQEEGEGEEAGGLNQGRRTTAATAAEEEDSQASREQQHSAVGRVSMWMQRGNCPHMVESTALLVAAVLSDDTANAGASTYAVRAAYAAAFSRFVTGLLDGHQDKLRKQSMYSIAKNIGLPATFVELRHQATHEQLPSLAKLRSAARKALVWIWDYYWKHLGEAEKPKDPCKELVLSYLRQDDETARQSIMRQLRQWPLDRLQKTIAELQQTLPGNQVFVKCLELSKEMAAMAAEEASHPEPEASGRPEEQEHEPDRDSEPDSGWSRYSGAWKPKPIGVV